MPLPIDLTEIVIDAGDIRKSHNAKLAPDISQCLFHGLVIGGIHGVIAGQAALLQMAAVLLMA